jgi:hypothetical protein
MSIRLKASLVGTTAVLVTASAHAHVGLTTPVFAKTTAELSFGIGHGCGTDDTYRVKVDIPAGVTNVRPMGSDFGKASVEKDANGNVTAITWQKADADLLPADTHYYKLTLRARMPDTPFVKLAFLTHQTCRSQSGTLSYHEWVGLPDVPVPDGGTGPEPAPFTMILPARTPGWNKITVPVDLKDLSFFRDALIVWKGTAAYSANANTAAQIKAEAGVTALTELKSGDEVWVKY